MLGVTAILIASIVGVDYGVVEDPERGSTYVIQIEPELVDQLVDGFVIESVIPPELEGVRRFRIQVGRGDVVKPPIPDDGGPSSDQLTVDPPVSDLTPPKQPETPDDDAFPLIIAGERPSDDSDAFPIRLEANEKTDPAPPSIIPDETVVPKSESEAVVIEPPSLEPLPIVLPSILPDAELLTREAPAIATGDRPDIPIFDTPDSREEGVVPVGQPVLEDGTADIIKQFDANPPVVLPLAVSEEPDRSVEGESNKMNVEPALLEENDAGFVQLASVATIADVKPAKVSDDNKVVVTATTRSWPTFTFVLLGFLLSVGGNVYLGVTLMGLYRKVKTTGGGG